MENEEALNAEMDKMREEDAQFNPNEVAEEAVETPEVEATEATEEAQVQETSEEVKEEVKEDEKEKHWAINAMHEERERRKEVQAQMNKMEDRFQ